MSNNFRWHGEDEIRWEEEEKRPHSASSRSARPWQRLLGALLLLLLLGGGGYWLYRQADERVEEASVAIKSDVRAAHDLVRRAAQRQDPELLRSVLSGRDESWVDVQLTLAENGELFDRQALGLEWNPESSSEPAISLDPELRRAEVTLTNTYTSSGGAEPVRLRHTLIFRRGSDHWLYAPPEEEFWGSGRKSQGKHLTLIYAATDDAWAGRLAADLDAQIETACNTLPDLNCDPDLHMTLTLHTNADAMLTLNDPLYPLQGELSLSLPALALFGTPASASDYEAVQRGYAVPLISSLIAHQVGYDCCEEAVVFQALLDYQLAQLGLRPWPVTQRQQQQVVMMHPDLERSLITWRNDEIAWLQRPEGALLYALVDFLTSEAATGDAGVALSALDLQRHLVASDGYLNWLWRAFAPYLDGNRQARTPLLRNELSARWRNYAYAQVVASQETPPAPLPAEDLLLFCQDAEDTVMGLTTTLYRYETAEATSRQLAVLNNSAFNTPLRTTGIIVHNNFSQVGERLALSLWREGEETAVLPDQQFTLSFGQTNPSGEFLTIYSAAGPFSQMEIQLVAAEECMRGDCTPRSLAGIPFWSPSGDHTLLAAAGEINTPFSSPLLVNGRYLLINSPSIRDGEPPHAAPLYRADSRATADSQIAIGYGYAPFWIDDERYGYVQVRDETATLVTASTADDTPQPLFGLARLTAELPGSLPGSLRYQIGYVAVNPADPTSWSIVVFDSRGQAHIFHYDWDDDSLTHRLLIDYDRVHALTYSPNGRWLLALGQEPRRRLTNREIVSYYLHDLENNATTTYYSRQNRSSFFDSGLGMTWTDDGDWLLLSLGENLLGFLSPQHDYLHMVEHDRGDCMPAIWRRGGEGSG